MKDKEILVFAYISPKTEVFALSKLVCESFVLLDTIIYSFLRLIVGRF